MNSRKKNQHFVPKFYLRNFSYLGNNRQIGLYNTRTKFYFKSAPLKSQASKDFYYGTDGVIEDELSEIEGDLSATIKKILESDSSELSHEDIFLLLLFIVLTDLRNPTKIEGFYQMINQTKEKLLEDSPDIKNLDTIMPMPSREDSVREMLRNCLEMVEGISDLKCKILINLTDTPFLTSDYPVVKYNQFLEWRRWRHSKTGYGSVGLQIFLPLNSRKMIFLFDPNSYEAGNPNYLNFKVKKDDDIDELNLLQLVNCIETIYFDEKVNESYVKELHELANQFRKANIPFTELAYMYENNIKPNRKNLIINGVTECETNLRISGMKIKLTVKQSKLSNSFVQLRKGSFQRYKR